MVSKAGSGVALDHPLGQSVDVTGFAYSVWTNQSHGAGIIFEGSLNFTDTGRVGQPTKVPALPADGKTNIIAKFIQQRRKAKGPVPANATILTRSGGRPAQITSQPIGHGFKVAGLVLTAG